MATSALTTEFILSHLRPKDAFRVRAMFGEYALYADDKVVALICDNQLYVKVVEASESLAEACELDAPYPGAKPHYVVEESQIVQLKNLSKTLLAIAASLPAKKKK
jgi:TfoX/Sxy family transcriptional regulator of competence genes